jgi:hypothetical protein
MVVSGETGEHVQSVLVVECVPVEGAMCMGRAVGVSGSVVGPMAIQ